MLTKLQKTLIEREMIAHASKCAFHEGRIARGTADDEDREALAIYHKMIGVLSDLHAKELGL